MTARIDPDRSSTTTMSMPSSSAVIGAQGVQRARQRENAQDETDACARRPAGRAARREAPRSDGAAARGCRAAGAGVRASSPSAATVEHDGHDAKARAGPRARTSERARARRRGGAPGTRGRVRRASRTRVSRRRDGARACFRPEPTCVSGGLEPCCLRVVTALILRPPGSAAQCDTPARRWLRRSVVRTMCSARVERELAIFRAGSEASRTSRGPLGARSPRSTSSDSRRRRQRARSTNSISPRRALEAVEAVAPPEVLPRRRPRRGRSARRSAPRATSPACRRS